MSTPLFAVSVVAACLAAVALVWAHGYRFARRHPRRPARSREDFLDPDLYRVMRSRRTGHVATLVAVLVACAVAQAAPEAPDFNRLVRAIYLAEGGPRARVPYGIESVKIRKVKGRYDVAQARRICLTTVLRNHQRWLDAGARGDFIDFLGARYAPVGAENDDRNLNAQWPSNVRRIYARLDLEPHAHRVIVAGSLRRERAEVGDVELVFIPRIEKRPRQGDLFGDVEFVDAADAWLNTLLRAGLLAKRPKENGCLTWGPENKLAIHVPSGIPVDLFATTEAAWFNYLVCRTGGAETPAFPRATESTSTASRASARQIGDKMGVPYQNVLTRVIAPMMRVGRAEMRMFSVPNILGVPRKIPHYRLKT